MTPGSLSSQLAAPLARAVDQQCQRILNRLIGAYRGGQLSPEGAREGIAQIATLRDLLYSVEHSSPEPTL